MPSSVEGRWREQDKVQGMTWTNDARDRADPLVNRLERRKEAARTSRTPALASAAAAAPFRA